MYVKANDEEPAKDQPTKGIKSARQTRTQQQSLESPAVTPPSVRVSTRYINSTKGTSSKKKDASSGIFTQSISGTLGDTGVYRHTTEPVFIQDRT